MVSSRFPVVTPAGRLTGTSDRSDPCRSVGDLLLADGGYSENSGLGTLSDLAPRLARIIAEHNASRPDGAPPVVPLVLYARNEVGADVSAPAERPGSELNVPGLALGVRDSLITDNAWLQRLSSTLGQVCLSTDDDCILALEQARGAVDGGVAVAAPTTRPALLAPLGWTLSSLSQQELAGEVRRLAAQDECTGRDLDFGSFAALLGVLGDRPVDCREE
jgi:hypothetical protein